ncbi:unnamed protein product [Camellia sinensis]
MWTSAGGPPVPISVPLVAEVLSRLIDDSIRNQEISRLLMKTTCPILSHLFFADDALLFLKASRLECLKMMQLLQVYSHASGQLINLEKSEVFFSANASIELKGLICGVLGISSARPHVKYLGIPSSWGRSKSEAYGFLVDKMVAKMQGWKNKLLSHARREVLIKAVVQTVPSYAMACFFFPKSFCNKLNMAIRNFWWKGDPTNKGIPWTKWKTMCSSKLHEGMGFRDFSAFNQAMLGKPGWRCITNPHSFWARLLKGLYFPHSSFMNASQRARGSWAWHSLIHGRELLKKGTQ